MLLVQKNILYDEYIKNDISNIITKLNDFIYLINSNQDTFTLNGQTTSGSVYFKEGNCYFTLPSGWKATSIIGFTTNTGTCCLTRQLLYQDHVNYVLVNTSFVSETVYINFQIQISRVNF